MNAPKSRDRRQVHLNDGKGHACCNVQPWLPWTEGRGLILTKHWYLVGCQRCHATKAYRKLEQAR